MTTKDAPLTAVEDAPLGKLVERAVRGDASAWDELVDRFAPLVWAVARSHGLTQAEAADVSRRIWRRLVEHLDRIPDAEHIGAWIATTTRDESLQVAHSAEQTVLTNDDTTIDLLTHDNDFGESTPGKSPSDSEIGDLRLWALFRQLPTRCQLLLRLRIGEYPLRDHDLTDLLELPIDSIPEIRACCLDQLRRLANETGIFVGD